MRFSPREAAPCRHENSGLDVTGALRPAPKRYCIVSNVASGPFRSRGMRGGGKAVGGFR